jgi:hypothetical protein
MAKFCETCGNEIIGSAKFCMNCGKEIRVSESRSEIRLQMNDSIVNEIPEKILNNLKNYPKHLKLTCLECGYVGLMGITKVDESQKNKWGIWVLGAIGFLFGSGYGILGIIAGLIFGALGGIVLGMSDREKIKTYVICPNCLKELSVK